MPGIVRTKAFVGVIYDGEDEKDVSYCPICEKHGYLKIRLLPRVLEKDEPEPPDYEEFLQCHKCWKIFPVYNTKQEGELYSDVEIRDNPFDFAAVTIEGRDDKGVKNRIKKRKQKEQEIKDKEVANELKKGGELLKYQRS